MGNKLMNRDTLTLLFDQRVAVEGIRTRNTVGSRLQFFGIAFSNLREFMQVRYPSMLRECAELEDPFTPAKVSESIEFVYKDTCEQFKKFNKQFRLIRKVQNLNKDETKWAMDYFERNVFPALLPITVDKARQANIRDGLYILVVTKDSNGDKKTGYIEIPARLGRFIPIPKKEAAILIEDLIQENLKKIYPRQKIMESTVFAITRSAEIYIDTDQNADPYKLIQQTLKEREKSWVTLVETSGKSNVKKVLAIDTNSIVLSNSQIRLSDLKNYPFEILSSGKRPSTGVSYSTIPQDNSSIFDFIKKKDRLLFHPFESYTQSVVRFLEDAAEDPEVVSIRICLYRVSDRSRIVDALMKAASNGKLVVALIELKARFDEKHNMEIANIMREGGVRIVYTKPDIKTHAKVCLVCRSEKKGLRIYSHVGTGNYSETNSRVYTDYSYFTADQTIGKDLVRFFNLLTSDQCNFKSRKVVYAPYNLKSTIVDEINHQMKLAKDKKSAQITIKCNALTDPGVADRLIEAAKVGVKIKLIVRTACIIEPQKNIQVYSIVGKYLEHSRVYVFGAGKKATVYIGSADMMTRNLSRRNELLLLVENRNLKLRILKHIGWYLKDNENRWRMKPKHGMERVTHSKKTKSVDCHKLFEKEAKEIAEG